MKTILAFVPSQVSAVDRDSMFEEFRFTSGSCIVRLTHLLPLGVWLRGICSVTSPGFDCAQPLGLFTTLLVAY